MTHDTAKQRILFDISDLVHVLLQRKSPTGIQRVQFDTLSNLLNNGFNVVPVVFSSSLDSYIKVDFNRIAAFDQKYLRRIRVGRATVTRWLRARFFWGNQRIRLMPSDTVFVSGSAISVPLRNSYLDKASRNGASVCWVCYDLIPVRHPEYTGNPGDSYKRFKTWIDVALARGDRFICISEFVRSDLVAYAVDMGYQVSAKAIPLAHEFTAKPGFLSSGAAQLAEEQFALFVSSVNVRKNQFGLVKLWSKLYGEFGEKLPTLVLVGQPWEADRLFRLLEGTGYIHGKVVHLADATDADLAFLYEKCDFTIFPSLYEGWGLPVGESLWMGKPCLSSNRTSLPEVGGPFVTYFDPVQDGEMERAVRNAMIGKFDAMPPPRDRLRKWQDVANDISAALSMSDWHPRQEKEA